MTAVPGQWCPGARLASLIGDDPTTATWSNGKADRRETRVRITSVSVDAVKILSAGQHRTRIYCQGANDGTIHFGEEITEIIASFMLK
jgi:hypothetical protein